MIKRHWNKILAGTGVFALLAIALFTLLIVPYTVAANTAATNQKIIRYVRERFGIPDATQLTVAPFQDSEFSDFYKTVITVQEGTKKSAQPALITKDGRYLVFGDIFAASPTPQPNIAENSSATDKKIVDFVRTKFKVPPDVKLTVGPFRESQYGDFYEAVISGSEGDHKSSTPAFITKDGRYTVIGSIFNLNADPRSEVESTISLKDQPTVGPADAPVTIVEFADLECPTCAETQQFFEQQLVPKYGNKIRIVFKEYPLVAIHDWALQAAIANECAYQLNPASYFRYRSIIYESQGMINAANIRQLMLDFGQRVGLNKLKLSVCMDSRASLPRIEADLREGQKLGIMSTPTLFINGTPVIGFYPDRIYQLINKALASAK